MDRFEENFGSKNESKIDQKLIRESRQEVLVPKTKIFKIPSVLQHFFAIDPVKKYRKIIKNQPNIAQKINIKRTSKFGSILDPTWPHFGRVLEAKMGPSWLKMGPKIDLKSKTRDDQILNGFKIEFGRTKGEGCLGAVLELF